MKSPLLFTILALACPALLGAEDDIERFPPYDNSKERDRFYAEYKDEVTKENFFQFKSLADLPANLAWTSGKDLPELGDPAATKGGTLRFFIPAFPPSLRIVGANANSSFRSEHWDDVNIYQVSAHLNIQGEYFPGIAREWAIADDHRTVFYRIDPAATFSNGDPILTADFLMGFYMMLVGHHNDPWYTNFYKEKYSAVTRYDDLTFSISLQEPRPDPVYWTLVQPYSTGFYKEYGPDFLERYNWRKYPTTGAYELDVSTGMIKGRSIVLHRVKNWWLANRKHYRYRYNVDYLSFDVIISMEKAFEAFKKGDLDYFPLRDPVFWYEKMEDTPFHNGYIHKAIFYNEYPMPPWGIYMNGAIHPLDNHDVRIGIQHALNWQKVIDVEFRGEFDRLQGTSDGFGIYANPNIKAREFSVEKARASFATAGYQQQDSDGVLKNANGERLSIQLLIRGEAALHRRIALKLKEEAIKAGLEITLEVQDSTSAFKQIREKNHQMTITAWASTPPYPVYWEGYHSANAYEKNAEGEFLMENGRRKVKPNTNNITSTADPALDKVIDAFEKAETLEELIKNAHEAERLIFEDASFSPGWRAPWYRYGYWRWVCWPPDFNVRISELPVQAHLHWINEDIKAETLRARKAGKAVSDEPVDLIFDQYRQKQ